MKIAVFGWYGHDNAGDERIKYCLEKFLRGLGGIKSVEFFDLHENAVKGATNSFDHYDLVIIGGGGLILSQCAYHEFINGINTKLVTLGISVERPVLTGNAKKFAQALIAKSSAFLVRDQESYQKLSSLDIDKKIKVSGDLTFLEPYEIAEVSGNNNIGINLLPKPAYFKYSTLCIPMFSFVLRQLERMGIHNIVKVVNFTDLMTILRKHFNLIPIPLYCAPQEDLPLYQKNDVEYLKQYFANVPSTFAHSDIDNCSLFLSMRLHGAIFSVQKGIPVVSLSYLPKNRNFMKEVGLENLAVDPTNLHESLKLIEEINHNREFIREKMISYRGNAMQKIQKDVTEILNII